MEHKIKPQFVFLLILSFVVAACSTNPATPIAVEMPRTMKIKPPHPVVRTSKIGSGQDVRRGSTS
jgi:hypothetical protein